MARSSSSLSRLEFALCSPLATTTPDDSIALSARKVQQAWLKHVWNRSFVTYNSYVIPFRADVMSQPPLLRQISPHLLHGRSGEMEGPYTPSTSTHVNGTNGINGTSPIPHDEAAPSSSFDPGIFRSYLLSLLPPVLGAMPAEIDSIFDNEFDERVTRFASEGTSVIYIAKRRDEVEGTFVLHLCIVSTCQF